MERAFANFQKYNEKGQRMNLFAEVNGDEIVIIYFPCSTKDQFSKSTAWEMYVNYCTKCVEIKSLTLTIIPVVENKPKKTFLNWCNENFYHMEDEIEHRYHEVEYLINKEKNKIVIKDKPYVNKLSRK